MSKYRKSLPQLADRIFLTDGGMETTLIFHEGLELPCFASFLLLDREEGRAALRRYYGHYAETARDLRQGLILDTATWRASADWGAKLGYDSAGLADVNRRAAALLAEFRESAEGEGSPIVVNGCIGPRGDGYDPGRRMSAAEAEAYHGPQVKSLSDSEADMIGALTMTSAEEAIGVVRAAATAGTPVAVSFTLETDGRLPTGQPLGEAVEAVDAATGGAPAYFMINCAHPSHFHGVLDGRESWVGRLRGLRANASRRSHAELDEAPDLDEGDPVELGRDYAALRRRLPALTVLGGCCGTDHRHIHRIGRSCAEAAMV